MSSHSSEADWFTEAENTRASKSKHWPAAFWNAIFSFTLTMNFDCPHWLQLSISGSADESTRRHLHQRKGLPEPFEWSRTHLCHIDSYCPFKDLATSGVWWVTASSSRCLDSQMCAVKKMIKTTTNVGVFTGSPSTCWGQSLLTHGRMCITLFTWRSHKLKSGYQGKRVDPKIHSRTQTCPQGVQRHEGFVWKCFC